MKNFMEAMKTDANFTRTNNGATALKSTKSFVLDFFAQAGAIRERSQSQVEDMFIKAFVEEPLLATKALFYARDIREGLGERSVFRIALKYLANNYPDIVKKNMNNIAEFGRYDDLFVLFDTPCELEMVELVMYQLVSDIKDSRQGKPISLLSKWMPSENTSSPATVALAHNFIKAFGWSPKVYRKTLTELRKTIKIVETFMSEKNWAEISYPTVPSKAMTNYRKAFSKQDADRFVAYLGSLKKGETKINASTLYPYDILEKAGLNMPYHGNMQLSSLDPVLQAQWDALPNYVDGKNNILVMADTSGSMRGRPMATSVGLAIYFAERNKGAYKDLFLTFSSKPSLVQLVGNNLAEKVRCVPSIVANTNLELAFDLVLGVAVKNSVPQEEMPKALVIISDMQMDSCMEGRRYETFYDSMEKKYANAGYVIPNVVFWNVNSTRDTHQVDANKTGVQLYSGQSPSTFKGVVQNIGKTPYDTMLQVLNNERYSVIRV